MRWVKMNTDGAVKVDKTLAGCGGIISSHKGEWVAGFISNLTYCHSTQAELMGILKGLEMAWSLEIRRLEVEADSKDVIESINDTHQDSTCHNYILKQIRSYKDRSWQITFNHIFREANKCANWLANEGTKSGNGFTFFDISPPGLQKIILDDASGVSLS
ncbi:hypothetical protein PIB30_119166 [Stylosanthes scabra]|uniref:RNase H type-1 domain-containing protein n=1 Tax=Stylosanthes scabra TaxID=79078 RepID=A0ABU6XPS3_9FABA|nr:hypothetical protein [Stylosanthes scabra]